MKNKIQAFLVIGALSVLNITAQEIEEILPECIKVSERGAKTVSNDPITWALVNAVKELSAKNDALAAEVEQLKSQLNN